MNRTILALVGVLIMICSVPQVYAQSWWDYGFGKKVPITVNVTSGTTLGGYQVFLNITYDSDMQTDFDDLRFINGSENAELSYCLGSDCPFDTSKANGSAELSASNYAEVWVRVDQNISTTNYTFYMYYENSSVTNNSNPERVFDIYDYFEDDSFNTSLWDYHQDGATGDGQLTEIDGEIKHNTSTGGTHWGVNMYTIEEFPIDATEGIEIVGSWRQPTRFGGTPLIAIFDIDTVFFADPYDEPNNNVYSQLMWRPCGSTTFDYATIDIIIFNISATDGIYYNNTCIDSDTGCAGCSNGNFTLKNKTATGTVTGYSVNFGSFDYLEYPIYHDNITIKKYHSPEPVYGFGNETEANITTYLGTNPIDNYNTSNSSVVFDLVCVSPAIDTLQLWSNFTYINGTWAMNQTNDTANTNIPWHIQVDGIPEGTHKWGSWCNSTGGNETWSETNRTFVVDQTLPTIDIVSPDNISYVGRIIDLNYSVADDVVGIDSCWYSIDDGTNVSLANCTNTSVTNLTYTSHNITVYVNDLAGNLNASTQHFYNSYALWNVTLYTENEWDTPFNMSSPDDVTLFVQCDDGGEYNYNFTSNVIYNLTPECNVESLMVKVDYPTDSYTREIVAPTGTAENISFYLVDAYIYSVLQIPVYMDDYEYYDSRITIYKTSGSEGDDSTYIITDGYFDFEHKFVTYLIKDSKYYIRITRGSEIRDIGYLYSSTATAQHLTIGVVQLRADISLISDNLLMSAEVDNVTGTLTAQYIDLLNQTTSVRVRVYEAVNQTPFFDNTYTSSPENLTITINGVNTSHRFSVHFTVVHEVFGNSPIDHVVGAGVYGILFDVGVSSWMYSVFGFVIMLFTSFAIVPRNRIAGIVFLAIVFSVLLYAQWFDLAGATLVLIIIFIVLSIIYEIRRSGMK